LNCAGYQWPSLWTDGNLWKNTKKRDVEEKDKIIIVMHTTSTNPADNLRTESIPEISSFTKNH
jgi:hypothetical protein